MPDFERLQENFEKMLDKSKAHKKPTAPKPFNFTDTSKTPKVDYLDLENDMRRKEVELRIMREKNEQNLSKMRQNMKQSDGMGNSTFSSGPMFETGSGLQVNATRKVLDQSEHNRKKALEKRDAEKKKRDADEARKKREREIADEVRANIRHENVHHDAEVQKSKQAKHWQTEKWISDYETDKGGVPKVVPWNEKVKEFDMKNKEKGPLLARVAEGPMKKRKDLEKMKVLLRVYDIYKKNREPNVEKQFTKEDWNMVQDGLILRGMGKI